MDVRNAMLMRVPAAVAEIKASHEGNAAVHDAELLVMSPIQNRIFGYSVDGLERISWEL
jgi:hypothetical protein